MGQVLVKVAGRDYTLACDDGEEQHLTDLAQYLDSKAKTLSRTFSHVGDTRLLLMAGLLAADELGDAVARIEELEAQVRALRGGATVPFDAEDEQAADLLEEVAKRLEAIAERVEAA